MKFSKIKSYVVDLDVNPSQRWNHILEEHIDYFPKVEKEIDFILKSVGILGGISKMAVNLFASSGNVMYKKELEGISTGSGIPLNKLILMQICYEMCAACTSIVIKGDKYNYHFRTMDWEMDFLRDLTIHVTFTKDGKELYQATTWAGYVGIATASNRNYSLALNYRRSSGTLLGNVMRTLKMKWPIGYMIRHVFENDMTCDQAYDTLSSCKLISPCYITFCPAVGEAKIIIREHDKTIGEKSLYDAGYLIQTNHDSDNSLSNNQLNIMWSFERYRKASFIMEQNYEFDNGTCTNINSENILQNFLVKPIINPHTIYTSLIVPKKNLQLSYTSKI